jgi:hypothetical protein
MSHPPKTPGAVVTAGVLLAVYGALLLICGFCGGVSLFIGDPNADKMMIDEAPGYMIVKFAEPLSNLFVGVTMIIAGVGLFQLMALARVAAYLAVIYQIFFIVVRNIYTAIFLLPLMDRLMAQQLQNQPAPFDMGQIMKGSMWAGIAISILIHLAFCVPILAFLSSKSARDAFSGVSQPDPDDDRERRPRHDGYDDDDDGYDRPKSPPKSPGDTGIRG